MSNVISNVLSKPFVALLDFPTSFTMISPPLSVVEMASVVYSAALPSVVEIVAPRSVTETAAPPSVVESVAPPYVVETAVLLALV